MHNLLYNNIYSVLTPSATAYDLGLAVGTFTGTNLTVRALEYGGTTLIARKERQYDLKDKDAKNAIIMIVGSDKDGKTTIEKATDKFLLQNIQKEYTEKVQLMETFDENLPSITFFGKKTPVYAFTGIFYNNNTYSEGITELKTQWAAGFEMYWKENLRGTELAKNKKLALLLVDDEVYEGYPITLSINKNSANEHTATFSMSWIITRHDTLLDKDALRDFMFFQDDKDLANALDQMLRFQRFFEILTDFMYWVNLKWIEQGSIFPASVPINQQFLIDKEIVTSIPNTVTYAIVDNEDGTKSYYKIYPYVNYTNRFKHTIQTVSDLLIAASLTNLFTPSPQIDKSFVLLEKESSVYIEEGQMLGLNAGLNLVREQVVYWEQRYNELMAEMTSKL